MSDLPEAQRPGYHRGAVLPMHRAKARQRNGAPPLGCHRQRRRAALGSRWVLGAWLVTWFVADLPGNASASEQAAPTPPAEAATPPAQTATPPAEAATPPAQTAPVAQAQFAPPMLVAAPPPTPPLPGEDPREADAHADRVLFLPTAYTHPEGTLYFASTELVVLQAGYAITDHTQITLTATPPIETLVPLDLSLKTALLRSTFVRVAGTVSASGVLGAPNVGLILIGRLGGVVQLCPDAACHSTLVATTNVTLVGIPVVLSGFGGVLRLSRLVSLIGEAGTVLPAGSTFAEANGAALSLGVRFAWRRGGVDVAVTRAWNAEHQGVTIPVLVASFRVL